ncbi:hypothetical protein AMS68_002878 [Peltaster fructicola]|uniref:S1 motif domain-containing protein n=1 Tax=Peltaster fructicola TaxID=286661 RepID=A0A6H0XRS9_9PEZI|nr:hypothetical protein AMS68_002878 [Peltaster fructicola]
MFFVHSLEHRINLHPSYFTSQTEQLIRDRLYVDVEGTNTGTMMIVAVINVQDISEPKIVPGTGYAQYDISYQAMVWRPYRGEVVDGLVTSVVNNGFFVEVAGLSIFVSKAMIPSSFRYIVEGSTPSFTDNEGQVIERSTQVRLRIKGVRGELGVMHILAHSHTQDDPKAGVLTFRSALRKGDRRHRQVRCVKYLKSRPPLLSRDDSQARFKMARTVENQKRKRVLVVGAGAAGMSCAEHLSNHPDKFDVTLVDAVDYCGGQAYSIPVDKEKTGASWLNQGVQGGSYIFHHTLTMFARNGFWADPVGLQVSFGKGEQFWTNVYPTKMLAKHSSEVKRFYYMLKIVRWFEVFFALLPIKYLVKLFWFSDEFANVVALPMIALFLGTGNYGNEVMSMILERLCTSPTYGMWYPPDKNSVASNIPSMVVFPNLSEFYQTWKKNLIKKGVTVRLSTEVTRVVRRDKKGVVVKIISRTPAEDGHNPDSAWVPDNVEGSKADRDATETTEEYDEIVLCVLTDTAKRLLSPCITGLENRVLRNARFANDITVTHQDTEYMKNHYENFYSEEFAVRKINGVDANERCDFGKKNFKPMYYIKMYPKDLTKLEMSFDATNYQPQFAPEVPFENHVFQTIFLNKERDGHLWSIDEIDESKIIRKDWWHQLCHSYKHYIFVVPWMWLLQGKRHTRYAASWTMINAHEVACISGISAAVDLGADYPADLERDKFSFLAFRMYYLLIYGRWYRRKATKHTREGEGKDWAQGNEYGSTYRGPGVNYEEERRIFKKELKEGRSKEF